MIERKCRRLCEGCVVREVDERSVRKGRNLEVNSETIEVNGRMRLT